VIPHQNLGFPTQIKVEAWFNPSSEYVSAFRFLTTLHRIAKRHPVQAIFNSFEIQAVQSKLLDFD
jgi:hypothetical protein